MENLISNNFLRKWKVLVTAYENGKSFSFDLSDLRCVFNVKDQCTSPLTECALEIYNLNNKTANRLLKGGFSVLIEAGYYNSRYGKIFEGDIIQSFRNYHDGIDEVLQILALSGNRLLSNNWISTSLTSGQTKSQVLKTIASEKKISIKKDEETQKKLDEIKYPRGQVIFGEVADVLANAAETANAVFQTSKKKVVELKSLTQSTTAGIKGRLEKSALNLNYKNGLVGSPVFSDQGITITSLLDSRIKPLSLVKVDNQFLERSFGNVNQIGIVEQDRRLIDPDGEYRVMSVTHSGDTRGDVWQTEMIGVGRDRSIKDMAIL